MDNILILENNPSDMKFLKTLPKYSHHNYFFTEEPGDALQLIEEKNIDVFVCPYEIKGFDANDILMTANFTLNHPLCILTSSADDIPGLLNCLNTNSVYRMVVKPFMNILDIKEAIEEAVKKRASTGGNGDDFLSGIIGDTKETAFWENHDRMIDFKYLKFYIGIYIGMIKDLNDEGESGNHKFLVEMMLQDIWDNYMRLCVLNKPTLGRLSDFFMNSSREKNESIGLEISPEVRQYYNERRDIFLAVLILREFIRHSLTDFNAEIKIKSDKDFILIKQTLISSSNMIPVDDFMKREASRLLSNLCYKFSIGSETSPYDAALLIKEDLKGK